MIIDIEPQKIIKSNDVLLLYRMRFYKIKRLYCFYRGDKLFSVMWTEDELKKFCPSFTVSEFIESITLNGISNFANYMSHWERGEHPLWTTKNEYGKDVPIKIDGDSRTKENAKYLLKNAITTVELPLVFTIIEKT